MRFNVDNKLHKRMQEIRRTLHRYPELAYQEKQTSALICQQLTQLGIDFSAGLATTGIRAELGTGEGPCVALRADMDALPIDEKTGLDFSSTNSGVMHACGHDGHVAMLLGAAELLLKNKLAGRVVLLFQPAEESGNGAAAMIADNCLQDVDMIFSGHIDTHYPVGQLTVDKGLICSYTNPFTIRILGQGGHAAKPHEAVDAIVVASGLVVNLQTLVSRRINPAHAAVVTVGRFTAGAVHNVIAEKAILEGTVRSAHPETRERIIRGLKRVIRGAGEMCNAEITLILHDGLPAVVNDEFSYGIAREAAVAVVGEENVFSQGYPSLGGEDFAFYQQQIPGCMIRFGAEPEQEAGPAHSCRFDFNEQVLSYGAGWLATVATRGLIHLQQQRSRTKD